MNAQIYEIKCKINPVIPSTGLYVSLLITRHEIDVIHSNEYTQETKLQWATTHKGSRLFEIMK